VAAGGMLNRIRILLAFAVLLLGAAAPAQAAWRRAESDHFIVYSQGSEGRIREQAALLEDYHQFLRLLLGVEEPATPNKLSIYMVRGPAQLRQIRNLPSGAAGFYAAGSTGIAAFSDETGGEEARNHILLHEIAHHFMAQYRPAPYPTWYVEGFAEYVSTVQFKKDVIEYGRASLGRAVTLTYAKWLPLERVLFGQVPTDRDEMAAFYAQSWLLAHYLLRDDQRRPKLGAYFAAVARGSDSRKAFAEHFPGSLDALEKELRDYLKRGMTFSRAKRASAARAPAIAFTTLPAAADDLLLLRATLEVGPDAGGEAALLGRIRAAAGRDPDDPFAKRVLAQAEALHGDSAKADALLTELLAARPNDAELLYFKGMRYLREARETDDDWAALLKEAQKWFARAHKADQNHFQTLLRYAESLRADRRLVSDNTINILLLARQLAPQVSEAAINAANLLLARKRYEEAEQLLLPLTADPHDTGIAAEAKALLERARARQEPDSAQE
jgi:Flp pilus assembly protein TadD